MYLQLHEAMTHQGEQLEQECPDRNSEVKECQSMLNRLGTIIQLFISKKNTGASNAQNRISNFSQ